MSEQRAGDPATIRGNRVIDLTDSPAERTAGDQEPIWADWGRGWVLAAKEPLDGSFLDPNLSAFAGSLDALDDALRRDFAAGDIVQLRAAYDGVTSAAEQVLRCATQFLDGLDAARWR